MSEAPSRPPLVIIESPFRGSSPAKTVEFQIYLRRALMDSIRRGEAPFASHGFYPWVLDESKPEERQLGISLGLAWMAAADLVAVYKDHGISGGMSEGIRRARELGVPIEFRQIGDDP